LRWRDVGRGGIDPRVTGPDQGRHGIDLAPAAKQAAGAILCTFQRLVVLRLLFWYFSSDQGLNRS